jgi:hypothetical protein
LVEQKITITPQADTSPWTFPQTPQADASPWSKVEARIPPHRKAIETCPSNLARAFSKLFNPKAPWF